MSRKKYEDIETVIGPNSTITGRVDVKGSLHVAGRIEGDSHADWVTIEREGRVTGDVHAQGVVVAGTVVGTLTASERVEVRSSGRVTGDLAAKKLVVEEGGILDGRSLMHDEAAAPSREPEGGADVAEGQESSAEG